MTNSTGEDTSGLDHYLPDWHFRERHRLHIGAAPDVVMRAVAETRWDEARLGRLLMRFSRNDVSEGRRILDLLPAENLFHRGDRELVYGMIGSDHGTPERTKPLREMFVEFDGPGYLKIGMDFRYVDGVLSTETRVLCTDAAGRRWFRMYWLVIRWGSGLIRRSALHAIKRRALRPT